MAETPLERAAAENASVATLTKNQKRKAMNGLRKLAECHAAWKRGESAPFEVGSYTFDRIAGSVALCDELHDELRACLAGRVEGVAHRLAELDKFEERLGDIARIEQAFFGTARPSEREGVDRLEHAQDGWRHGASHPVVVGGVTFDRLAEPGIEIERDAAGEFTQVVTIHPADRTAALYEVLCRAVRRGEAIEHDAILKRADALADAVSARRGQGVRPAEF